MSGNPPRPRRRRIAGAAAVVVALIAVVPTPAAAQRRPGGGIARRGAPGAAPQPMTDVAITVGGVRTGASVDAECHVNRDAAVGGPKAYYVMMYPWFGQRVAPDKPQWRANLEVRRGAIPDRFEEFVFSFLDPQGRSAATIQTMRGAERMGSGTVRVTRHDSGARFEVQGRSKEGQPVQATIDCSRLQGSEGAGG